MVPNFNNYICFILILTALIGCTSCAEKSANSEQVKDIDGNAYRTIQIGEQVWMAENLKTTRLVDGSPIQLVEKYEEWANLTLPAYCWYNNDSLNGQEFGALYNYYVVESDQLCPEGWHVPTDEDWIALEIFNDGAGVAGGPMKEAGTAHWKGPNTSASNDCGFTALPGGYRSYNGTFNLMRIEGFWWSSTEKSWYGSKATVLYRNLSYDDQSLMRDVADKPNGFSVRCVKNKD